MASVDFVARSEFSIKSRRVSNHARRAFSFGYSQRRAVKRATHAHSSGERGQHRRPDKNRRDLAWTIFSRKLVTSMAMPAGGALFLTGKKASCAAQRPTTALSVRPDFGRPRGAPCLLFDHYLRLSAAVLKHGRDIIVSLRVVRGKLHWHHHASRNGAMILERPRRSNGPRSPIRKTDDQN